jgi:hypothetical protein
MIPIGLMAVPLPGGRAEFLGFHFRIESPLNIQDYTPSRACISKWVLLIPPDKDPIEQEKNLGLFADEDLEEALLPVKDLLKSFSNWGKDHAEIYGLLQFRKWLENSDSNNQSGIAVLTLSHHEENKLFFANSLKDPSILSNNISRKFPPASLAIINACGTARPGAWDFVRSFNEQGVSAVIATSTTIDSEMAGNFLAIFANVLHDHAKDPKYSLAMAKFEAVLKLSQTKSEKSGLYGPRALVYNLLGNGNLRLCGPPLEKPSDKK